MNDPLRLGIASADGFGIGYMTRCCGVRTVLRCGPGCPAPWRAVPAMAQWCSGVEHNFPHIRMRCKRTCTQCTPIFYF